MIIKSENLRCYVVATTQMKHKEIIPNNINSAKG